FYNSESVSHEKRGKYNLELNHTHYIFFDDGTRNSLDDGEFAATLAREISRGARRRIPLITILVGGTLHALYEILNDLKHGVPIVVVEVSHKILHIR
ncbi:unnamed protein product, partial [Rotaria sp. Silwood2]